MKGIARYQEKVGEDLPNATPGLEVERISPLFGSEIDPFSYARW
jgi:hypothetical protein